MWNNLLCSLIMYTSTTYNTPLLIFPFSICCFIRFDCGRDDLIWFHACLFVISSPQLLYWGVRPNSVLPWPYTNFSSVSLTSTLVEGTWFSLRCRSSVRFTRRERHWTNNNLFISTRNNFVFLKNDGSRPTGSHSTATTSLLAVQKIPADHIGG